MNCPKDNGNLISKTVEGVGIEECEICGGLWFNKGELSQVIEQSESDYNWMDFDLWREEGHFKTSDSALNCPQCDKKMVAITYGEKNIQLDLCEDGHGIWLDKGEFKSVLSTLQEELTTKDVSEYIQATIEEGLELFTGPESFISDWKDFSTVFRFLQYRILSENPKLLDSLISAHRSRPF